MRHRVPPRPGSTLSLPTIEIRFPATYAWGLMALGVIFFLVGFLPLGKNPGLGVFIMSLSVAAVIGGNYWRHHLHVVARLTPKHLILRRGGAVDWTNIASIEKKTIHARYRGAGETSEFICIRLRNKRPPAPGLEGWMDKMKTKVTGYDLVVPGNEMSCTADWFIAECQKRMTA